MVHVVQTRFLFSYELRSSHGSSGKEHPGFPPVDELQAFGLQGEEHSMFSHDAPPSYCMDAQVTFLSRRESFSSIDPLMGGASFLHRIGQKKRCSAGRILFPAMMLLDDFHIRILSQKP